MIDIRKTSSLLLWVLLLVSCVILSCAKEASKLKLATLQCNLSNLDAKHRAQTIFVDFTNQGSDELMITDVKTDCDCAAVRYPKGAHKCHMGDKIKIRVDLTPFSPGPILKKVAVYVNDQPKPVIIAIKGNVI